jgi:hypothetical protein
MFAEVSEAGAEGGELGGGGGGGASIARDVLLVLLTAARLLRADKYQTPKNEDEKEHFYRTVAEKLWPSNNSYRVALPETEQTDLDLAEEALAFCAAGGDSTYRMNLQTYAELGVVDRRGLRLVASAVGAMLAERARKLQNAQRKHVGVVGEKLVVAVQVARRFGLFQILVTAAGDTLTVRSRLLSVPGEWQVIETTVTAHDAYKGVPQTQVKGFKWLASFTGPDAHSRAARAAEQAQDAAGLKALRAAAKKAAKAAAAAAPAN